MIYLAILCLLVVLAAFLGWPRPKPRKALSVAEFLAIVEHTIRLYP